MPRVPASPDVSSPHASSVISGHLDTRTAATEVAEALFDELGSGDEGTPAATAQCDLALVFGSFHHRAAFSDAAEIIRKTISPRVMLGVTAEAVLGGERELEGVAGLSAIAMRLPGVRLHAWSSTPTEPMPLREPQKIRQRMGIEGDQESFRTAIMLADPFTTPITRLLPALTSSGEDDQPITIIGGMASGASQPGMNVMVLNERVLSGGAVGVSMSGDIDIDFIVSQGCRPIGKPLVITKSRDNVILELGGRKAIETLHDVAVSLPPQEKELLKKGVLVGTVINEYKERFGRGDFLVRGVLGLDQKAGGIAVGEMCRVGQTIQFHVRDAETAAEDLQLLLDAQVMNSPPFAGLLFSCNGRGERLFGRANHDVGVIHERLGQIPIAGFFAAGEFGPIGNRSFLHGHTASLALLRGRGA